MIDENQPTETEILSADERRLREMCLSLKKIEAPKDFEQRVKARIANAKSPAVGSRFGWAFRYALPALALLLVLGLLAYSSRFRESKDNVASAENPAPVTNPAPAANSSISNFTPPETKETPVETAALPPEQRVPKISEKDVADGRSMKPEIRKTRSIDPEKPIGSEDKSQKVTPVVQPNPSPKTIPQIPQIKEAANPMTVKDVLSTNGINAAYENGKWTVKSVTANGVGESSGIRENDVIEAIDNKPIANDTVFNKTADGQTVTVTRNGAPLKIKLRNKQ